MVQNDVTYIVRIQGKPEGCHGCAVSLSWANSLTAVSEQSIPSAKAGTAAQPIIHFYLTPHYSQLTQLSYRFLHIVRYGH